MLQVPKCAYIIIYFISTPPIAKVTINYYYLLFVSFVFTLNHEHSHSLLSIDEKNNLLT